MPVAPIQAGFSVITDNSDFSGLDFDSGMTTLFTNQDEAISGITMPNSNFTFNGAAYAILYLRSNGWLSFGTNVAEVSYGGNSQQPINTLRFFSGDHESTGSYKFVSNNTRLLFKLSGYPYGIATKRFTIKVIIEQSGEIRINYTLASTYILDPIIIGFVGSTSSATSDDIFLTLNDVTFNGATFLNLFSLLNGKSILYMSPKYPTFQTFSLPTDIQVYRNQTITRVLTPPTSNSSGAFTFTSSNTAVATISISGGVSSINVIGAGTTTITAIQAASGVFVSQLTTASLTVTVLYPTFGPVTLPSDIQVNQNQTITRVLTPPTSNSSGSFTFTSSNTDVATISINGGVSSINVIGGGTSIITATQSASGDFASSSITVLLNTVTGLVSSFSVITDSDFSGLDFDSGMTTLIDNVDDAVRPITMPNSNFMFNAAAYSTLYLSSNGWLSFGTNVAEVSYGENSQQPISTFRFFSGDHMSTGSYKFVSNNTRLLIKLTGWKLSAGTNGTFTIKLIIEQSGEIRTNYTLASTFITSDKIIIGYVGNNSSATSDDIFLTLGGVTFNGATLFNLFSLLNGKNILFISGNYIYPTFGSFTLPSDIQLYQNQITTRVLTPPTSNSLGAFTFTSSNTAVATISTSGGVSSINVIGTGTTTIIAIQAASSSYGSSSVTASLTVIPMLSLADLPVKLTIDSSFSLSDFVTNNSTGVLSYESSAPSVATVNSSSGLVTLAGAGTTTITVSVAASSDGLYAAASVTRQLVVIMPITLAANGVTIKYNGPNTLSSEPLFVYEDPRNTGAPQWFAVVTNNSSAQITSYAKSAGSAVSAYFTPPGQSDPVLFKNIVTSLMTNMSDLFSNALAFDQDISSWDTSRVINMSSMFTNNTVFTNGGSQEIGNWNTSNVIDMGAMFNGAQAFNQNIGSWDTSKVQNMSGMFFLAKAFNKNIGGWITSKVTAMEAMFYGSSAFDQPIGGWDTSKVTNMNSMFQSASLFNQNISGWDVSFVSLKPPTNFSSGSALIAANTPVWFPITLAANLVTIQYTLTSIATEPRFIRANPRGAAQPEWFAVVTNASKSQITSYAKSIGSAVSAYFTPPGQSNPVPFNNIVTTLMTDMSNMFYEATTFNQPIGSWDTSKVTNMNSVFQYAYKFNQNIGSWNTALVANMVSMFFGASVFDQNIGSWNTSKVTNMISMFYYAEAFNQNISVWNVSLVSTKPPPNFSTGSPLTAANTPVWFQ